MGTAPADFSAQPQRHWRFGDWLVIPSENLIERDGRRLTLEPKVMQVLVYLAEHAEQVISTEQLLIDCWRGTFYGDNPVHKTIAVLRKALGDSSVAPQYIQTIRKRGYRVVAAVSFPEGYDSPLRDTGTRWSQGCPYRGLESFEPEHSGVFHGRSRATAQLLRTLRDQVESDCAFVMVVGASGSGKSSLIRAGALPMLTRSEGFNGLHVPFVAILEPDRGAYLVALARALTQWSAQDWPVFLPSEQTALVAQLRDNPEAVVLRIRECVERVQAQQPQIQRCVGLIIVDPMEALLLPNEAQDDERQCLLRALTLFAQSGVMAVLAACRADRYALLAALPALAELKANGNHFDLFPPSPGEIGDMIRLPAAAAGLSFGRDPEMRSRLDDVLRDAAVRQPDALPLLQHVLKQLYEHRDADGQLGFAAYHALGGLEGALAKHAEAVLAQLPAEHRQALPGLLQRMIHLDQHGDVLGHAVNAAELEPQQAELARALVDARLFVSQLVDQQAHYSAVHDALWRQWPRVTRWIDANRAALDARGRVELALRRWLDAGRPRDLLLAPGLPLEEARALLNNPDLPLSGEQGELIHASIARERTLIRARRLTLAAIVGLSLASGIGGLYAWHARGEAQAQRASAESLVSFMLGELTQRLRPLGKLDLLDSIAAKTLQHLQQTSLLESSDPASRLHHATALSQIGEIAATRGEDAQALTSFAKADDMLRSLAEVRAKDPEFWWQWAQVQYWLGEMASRRLDLDAAQRHFESYRQLASQRASLAPDDPSYGVEVAYALSNLGMVAERLGQFEMAQQHFDQAVSLQLQALQNDADNGRLQSELANYYNWQARVLESSGRLDAAAQKFASAAQSADAALKNAAEDDTQGIFLAASAHANVAAIEEARGNIIQAIQEYHEAKEFYSKLTQVEPSSVVWIRELSYTVLNFYRLKLISEQVHPDQLDAVEANAEQLRLMARQSPDQTKTALRAARGLVLLADFHLFNRDSDAARMRLNQATELLSPYSDGNDIPLTAELGHALYLQGVLFDRENRSALARQQWLTALDLMAPLFDQTRQDYRLLDAWARTTAALGRQPEASAAIAQLRAMGYAAPSFMEFLALQPAADPAPLSPPR